MDLDAGNSVLGALLSGVATLLDPSERRFDINAEAPADHRPLRLSVGSRATEVHPSDLSRVALVFDAHGMPAVALYFEPELRAWIAEATTENIGAPMDLFLCDELVTSPRIMEPITGGNVQITGQFEI